MAICRFSRVQSSTTLYFNKTMFCLSPFYYKMDNYFKTYFSPHCFTFVCTMFYSSLQSITVYLVLTSSWSNSLEILTSSVPNPLRIRSSSVSVIIIINYTYLIDTGFREIKYEVREGLYLNVTLQWWVENNFSKFWKIITFLIIYNITSWVKRTCSKRQHGLILS